MDKNRPYYLGFSHFPGVGPMKFKALMEFFGSVERAYCAPMDKLLTVVGEKLALKFAEFRNTFDPVARLDELGNKGISVLTTEDDSYPDDLKNISDPPICLYVKGKLTPSVFFSIVGTRTPTQYGCKVTCDFAYTLSKVGITVVSGLALGVDAIAHKGALDAGGKTVAVLGCGVDVVYPPGNRPLYEDIVANAGAIISEFPPGQRVTKGLFVARNRIVSGISKGILIVEGGEHSGTLITARFAADQGRDVFVIPGPITSDMSRAPNLLIKHGARLVVNPREIIEEYSNGINQ